MSGAAPVLVACPTFAGKAYALDAYLAAYEALEYEPRHLFMVDTTRGSDTFHRQLVDRGLDAMHVDPFPRWPLTLHLAWAWILKRAMDLGAPWVLSLEADIIAPPSTLAELVQNAVANDLELVLHPYPNRASVSAGGEQAELGCTLMTTSLLFSGLKAALNAPEGHFLLSMLDLSGDRWSRLTSPLVELVHLDGGGEDQWQFGGPDVRLRAASARTMGPLHPV